MKSLTRSKIPSSAILALRYRNLRCSHNHRSKHPRHDQSPSDTHVDGSRVVGPSELVSCLLSLSSLTNPLSNATSLHALAPTDVPQFLQDLAQRFANDDEFANILGPVIVNLLRHESLFRPEGLGSADTEWRGVVGGMEALVSIKPIATLITKLPEWNPPQATASDFEKISLMGPLLRLGVFYREWVCTFNRFVHDKLEDIKFATAINWDILFFGTG